MEYLKDSAICEFSEQQAFNARMVQCARRNITRVDGSWSLNLHGKEYRSQVLADLLLIVKLDLVDVVI